MTGISSGKQMLKGGLLHRSPAVSWDFSSPCALYPWEYFQAFPSTKSELWSLQRKYCWRPGLWKPTLYKSCPARSSVQLRSLWQSPALWLRSPTAYMYPRSYGLAHNAAQPITAQCPCPASTSLLTCGSSSSQTLQLWKTHKHGHWNHAVFSIASLGGVKIFFPVIQNKRTWHTLWSGGKLLEKFLLCAEVSEAQNPLLKSNDFF